MKLCPTCKEIKSESEFYKDERTPDGLKSQCKKCHIAGNIKTRDKEKQKVNNRNFMRKYRENNLEKVREREKLASRKRVRNEKTLARQILNSAVRSGKIIKPKFCSGCQKPKKLTAHHPNYSKPLDVIWLCYTCHGNN